MTAQSNTSVKGINGGAEQRGPLSTPPTLTREACRGGLDALGRDELGMQFAIEEICSVVGQGPRYYQPILRPHLAQDPPRQRDCTAHNVLEIRNSYIIPLSIPCTRHGPTEIASWCLKKAGMDRLAVELLEQIFLLACTDGGLTGCSLALVSKRINAASRTARYNSVALLSRSPKQVALFYRAITNERVAIRGVPPKVRHLCLASAVRRIQPEGRFPYTGARAARSSNILTSAAPPRSSSVEEEESKKHLHEQMAREERTYHADVAALLQLVAPDLHSLCIIHCHRPQKVELRFQAAMESAGFPLLRELTIVGNWQPKRRPERDDAPYPRLKRLHLALVSLAASQSLDVPRWVEDAPRLSHLRISNLNYWPKSVLEALRKAFESKQMRRRLEQVIAQPHSPPPMGGPCGTPHFVYADFMQQLREMWRPSEIPTLLLPNNKDMRERDWEVIMTRDWLDRLSGGPGCWDMGDPRAEVVC